jgi:hypothetical protein
VLARNVPVLPRPRHRTITVMIGVGVSDMAAVSIAAIYAVVDVSGDSRLSDHHDIGNGLAMVHRQRLAGHLRPDSFSLGD